MRAKTIKNLKSKVRAILKEYPEARNSDITLTLYVWKKHFPQRIVRNSKNNLDYVALKDLYDLPREDNIKRVRAKIQSPKSKGGEERYLPTDRKVAEQRKINMDIWHKAMGFNNYI